MNDNREFSVYLADKEPKKIFGPVECLGFTTGGICINNDFTLTIYDGDFLENQSCRKWTTTWKLSISQVRKIRFTSFHDTILSYKNNQPKLIQIWFIMTKEEFASISENLKKNFRSSYRKFYDFETGCELFPNCKIL